MSDTSKTPWLSKHRVAKPCSVKWSSMQGDERKRFCGQCKLNVYNLSAMATEEAEALLARKNGKICTYFYRRTDGTVLTQDCPVGLRQIYRKRGLIAAALYLASALASSCFGQGPLMGKRVADPTQFLGGAPAIMGDYMEPLTGETAEPRPDPSPEPPAPALTPEPPKE